ncbi:hypothetical protein NA56DRAFT_695501 [Hyaloscypha hepaticicola]|uniref:Zn(2)-C6 fungal-type domain-containing protein n=1 Tax=Hyaloscypha hepaticicola TaxID=2082293 RepID=A0A2J6PEN9_9HELO|nr:hypothetical protein NA56DRAFT_695501 [Hyaloscypha hepaticicola]
MSSVKAKKACANCYQKKIRCDWNEAAAKCVFCTSHDLQCYIPDPTKPVQRTAIRDTLIDIQARLERLESQRTSSAQPFTVSKSNQVMKASYVDPYPMSIDLSIAGPSTDHTPILETESDRRISSIDPQVLAIDNSEIQLPEHTGLADRTDTEGSSSRSNVASVQTYLGNSSTWELLAEGISPSSGTVDTSDFRRNIDLLSKEDRSILQDSQYFSLNLLVQFPRLTPELVILYSSHYALEAPFITLHWPSLKRIIEQGLSAGKWSCQGQVACVLLYLAFGSSQVPNYGPEECQMYFAKAWSMLSDLILRQDLWSLKALTLMVHWLQGGALPNQCYALIGCAIRIGVGLGLHVYGEIPNIHAIEAEEARRSLWLCYIMDMTLSAILGRPGTSIDMSEITLPITFAKFDAHLQDTDEKLCVADREAVFLFHDTIEIVRTRTSLLRQSGADEIYDPVQILDRFEQIRALSQLEQSIQVSEGPPTIRATIYALCNNTSIIVTDRVLGQARSKNISPQSVSAATRSIALIIQSHSKGLTMCLWMWLYYAFTSAVGLFISVLADPLHKDATLHLAFISDVENICSQLAKHSPGASRVMKVTREMGKVGFQIMKSSAKRKAGEELQRSKGKSVRVEDSSEEGNKEHVYESVVDSSAQIGFEEDPWLTLPVDFSWDHWDQYLGYIAPQD